MSNSKTVFEVLAQLNLSQFIKTVQNQSYAPWADIWNEVKKVYPRATWSVALNKEGMPYFMDESGGFVRVTVNIEDETQTLNHPILNSANKAMKKLPYTYTTRSGERQVEAASAFDINTTQMRGLAKCLGLMGAGLYIYRDEQSPDMETVDSAQLQAITDKIREKGINLQEVCQYWQIEKIAHLYEINYENVILWLETQ